MPPRKRPLLDVLREKERRHQGRREDGAMPAAKGAAPPLTLPPWALPALGILLILVLGGWGLSHCGGAPSSSTEQADGDSQSGQPAQSEPQAEGLAVLAITYDAGREDLAIQVARTLRDDFGYDVRLARKTAPDGRGLRELYVVGAKERSLSDAELLSEIQALRLPGRPNEQPFAGASLRRLPQP